LPRIKIDALRNRGAPSATAARHISHLDLKLKIDLEKVVGWNGGSAMINVVSDGGRGPNARHVASHMGVTNLEVASADHHAPVPGLAAAKPDRRPAGGAGRHLSDRQRIFR
jgi:hypothetical protein